VQADLSLKYQTTKPDTPDPTKQIITGPKCRDSDGLCGRGGGPLMQVLDADKDRTLSADEISSASTALLTLDEDGDGMLSNSELRPGPPHSRYDGRQQ